MNKALLIGRLTKDVELRKTNSGKSYTKFTLAVNRDFQPKDAQGPTADFISCVAWEHTADFICNFCNTGSRIGIEGGIQTGSYQNQQGQTIYTTDVLVNRVDLLDPFDKDKKKTPYKNTSNVDLTNVPFDENVEETPGIDISPDDLPFY